MIKNITKYLLFFALFFYSGIINGQIREYKIHNRGMLHQTVFNTGEIGRAWTTGVAGNETSVPLFEWPARSSVLLPGNKLIGQHNMVGGGVYIAANVLGKLGNSNREYAFCGGVGSGTPEVSFGIWTFPYYMNKIENYPVLPTGKLNPSYNPDEAEEIITAGWATNTGISVHRESRAFSYPDYDDMIIYEYTFENTGDTDGNPNTIERDTVLNDVIIGFVYGMAPSMYGYIRHYNEWKYESGMYRGDQRNAWDYQYWLSFNLDVQTNLNPDLAAKPEPNDTLFMRYAKTGERGGGLASPQAPGYCILYYDKNHLSKINPWDSTLNESETAKYLTTSSGEYYELDENLNLFQPFRNRVGTGNTLSTKMKVSQGMNPDERSNPYKPVSGTWPEPPPGWIGRSAFNYRQSDDAVTHLITFGPYRLKRGDKIKFALAEVCGYGGKAGKRVEGIGKTTQWTEIPSMDKKVVINGKVMTNNYIKEFGYPDYINSKNVVDTIISVQDVARQAFKAYTGNLNIIPPMWPGEYPNKGSYKVPLPFPAPAILVNNTVDGNVQIKWIRDVENFTHPRLMGQLAKFNIYKSNAGMGPWSKLTTINLGESLNNDGIYEYFDKDSSFKVGEKRFYAVTSVDVNGNESGKTNVIEFAKNIGSVKKLDKVYVVPNPFVGKSGYQGSGNVDDKIGFYGLPEKCSIRIFSYSGQLIHTIEHDTPLYSTEWFQTSRNGQDIASGLYFYVVTTPAGEKQTGKFVVIK